MRLKNGGDGRLGGGAPQALPTGRFPLMQKKKGEPKLALLLGNDP